MQNPSEEIKSKLDIVDVLKEYIQLQPAGVNFRARCPFHHEKTPSFVVSPDKQIWHCFGCGKGGDIFTFIMEIEGLSFAETLRQLAPKAGVTLKKSDPALSSQRNKLLDIMDLTAKYYFYQLRESQEAAAIRDYLKNRGLTAETIEEWQIGYSSEEWENLCNFLKKRGVAENDIFLAGLSIRSNNRPGFYDRFRGRVMFPIRDINGNVVAFSARIRPDREETEKMGKYINSPQTMIYDKSHILFGLDKAKHAIKQQDLAIVVEGQMDAITAHQHGFKNLVASSGTALTVEQVSLLKRFSQNIALSFDMDKAGEMAAERGMRAAMSAEMNIKIIELPQGKDPDECIKKNPQDFTAAVAAAKPMMQYYLDRTLAGLDLNKIENRRQAAKTVLPVIVNIKNKIEQDYWLKQLSESIDVPEAILRETIQQNSEKKSEVQRQDTPANKQPSVAVNRDERLSEILIALILRHPELVRYSINNLPVELVAGNEIQSLYKYLLIYYNNLTSEMDPETDDTVLVQFLNYHNFKNWLQSEIETDGEPLLSPVLDRIAIFSDKEFYDLAIESARNEAIKIALFLKKNHISRRMKEIEKLIAESEKKNDVSELKVLVEEFKILAEEIRSIEF